jgi:hypothetical protein
MLYDDAIKELGVSNGDGFSGSKFLKKLKDINVDGKSEKVIVIAEMDKGDDGYPTKKFMPHVFYCKDADATEISKQMKKAFQL